MSKPELEIRLQEYHESIGDSRNFAHVHASIDFAYTQVVDHIYFLNWNPDQVKVALERTRSELSQRRWRSQADKSEIEQAMSDAAATVKELLHKVQGWSSLSAEKKADAWTQCQTRCRNRRKVYNSCSKLFTTTQISSQPEKALSERVELAFQYNQLIKQLACWLGGSGHSAAFQKAVLENGKQASNENKTKLVAVAEWWNYADQTLKAVYHQQIKQPLLYMGNDFGEVQTRFLLSIPLYWDEHSREDAQKFIVERTLNSYAKKFRSPAITADTDCRGIFKKPLSRRN